MKQSENQPETAKSIGEKIWELAINYLLTIVLCIKIFPQFMEDIKGHIPWP